MKQVQCPNCNSLKAQKVRRMWKKDKDGKVLEGMQYRCSNPECKRWFVIYPS